MTRHDAFVWVARVAMVGAVGGASIVFVSVKMYVSRLESLVEHLKQKEGRVWRRLGSPDTPLTIGFSSGASGRRTVRFMLRRRVEGLGPDGERLRLETRKAFLAFAAGTAILFVGLVAVPVAAVIARFVG